MDVIQRERQMRHYLLLAKHCSQQLNQMNVRSDLNFPVYAERKLSNYRVKTRQSLIILRLLRNDLKDQNLKRANLISRHVNQMLTEAIVSHRYFTKKDRSLNRFTLYHVRNDEQRMPTTDEVIKHRKRIFRNAAAGIDSNLQFNNSANDGFHSLQKIFLIFIAGIVLIFVCLLGYWAWSILL